MKQTLNKLGAKARLGVILGGLLVGLAGLTVGRMAQANDAPKIRPVTLTVSETPLVRQNGFTSFAPVVKRVAPSVVKVNITTKSKTLTGPESPFGENDLLRRFFGDQFGQGRTYRTPKEHGLGSGVIVSKDGYILTNNHVVDEADTIEVTLNDGRQFTAKVVGRDPKSDVAVVKIEAANLPVITIADSDKIEVGDVCLAVGNPFGIGQTVTSGIVSAIGRGNLGLGTDYEDFIQTDAAINPGNSGGALVDAEGRLIGINTAILSRTGGNQGIGFAVPINMARNVMENLISNGRVVRGFLGVSIQDVTPALASEFKLPEKNGALVGDITPRSPAEKAGLRSGDVIVDFNHKPVADSRHLKLQVADTAPGATVPLKFFREGSEKTVEVTLKELPGSEQTAKVDDKGGSSDALNGVTVADIDANTKGRLELPRNIKGAVVTEVDPNSASYEAGIRPGDVIEEINHTKVNGADDAVRLTTNVKNKVALLKIWSRGGSRYLIVDESKSG